MRQYGVLSRRQRDTGALWTYLATITSLADTMLGLRDLGSHHGRPVGLWVVAATASLLGLWDILARSVADGVAVRDYKVWSIHDEIGWSCSWK